MTSSPTSADPLDRPIFVVGPPCSGEGLLAASLFAAPGSWHAGDGADALVAGVEDLVPDDLGVGNRLTAEQGLAAAPALRAALLARYESLDMTGRPGDAVPRLFDASPRGSLRVPFLAAAFPDAQFVYIHREPRHAVANADALWRAEQAVTYPDLKGWSGPPWSLLLVPGWRELDGLEPEEIVVEQWRSAAAILLNDLEALERKRWYYST